LSYCVKDKEVKEDRENKEGQNIDEPYRQCQDVGQRATGTKIARTRVRNTLTP